MRAHDEEVPGRAERGEVRDVLEEGAPPSSTGGAVRDDELDGGKAGKVAERAQAEREAASAEAKAKVALKSPHWKKAMAKVCPNPNPNPNPNPIPNPNPNPNPSPILALT